VSMLLACTQGGTTPEGVRWLEDNAKKEGVVVLESGMQYKIKRSGKADGPQPLVNSPCECHYRGKLTDGSEFDSSYKRGKPTTFAPNQVIEGWTEAMQLMHEGDFWELYIPSELAYGDCGSGPKIPGGLVLVFDLEILKVMEPSQYVIFGVDFSQPQNMLMCLALAMFLWAKLRGSSLPAREGSL